PGNPAPSCDSALIEVIRHGIPWAAPRAGIHALGGTDGSTSVRQLARGTDELRGLALELAARGAPFVDLPACLGGTQVGARVPSAIAGPFITSDACPTCPLDATCAGASGQLEVWPSSPLRPALHPLPAWYSSGRSPRVLILSSLGGDGLFYISTLPALGHAL